MMNMRRVTKQDAGKDDERRHVTGLEVEKLLAATKGTRHAARERFAFGARTHARCACRAELDGPTWFCLLTSVTAAIK
jgi:hypothetical protein